MGRWVHSTCTTCWNAQNPDRVAVRLHDAKPETCCFCGSTHQSGIYVRHDPTSPTLKCGGRHDDN